MSRRLLVLIPSLSMGGAERVAATLANHWARNGYSVAVATLSGCQADFYQLDPSIERFNMNIARSSCHSIDAVVNNLRIVWSVRRLLKRWQPQVAIGFMTAANVYIALAGVGLRLHKIGSEHIHPPMYPLGHAWEWLRAQGYGFLDHLVALTEESADWLRRNTMARRVAVIGNPIPWPLPSLPPLRDPRRLLSSRRRHLLAVGRLVEQKGFDLLVDAFARLISVFDTWDLIIVGEGPMRKQLEAQIARLELRDRVHLVGGVGNIGDWYSACDLYVMSSRFEGFGNTLAEAMSYGLPAVSFDCKSGPKDIIRHGVDGFLVPAADVDSLAAALAQLMKDKGVRERFSLRATEARERFSLDKIAGQWAMLFEERRI